MYFPDRHVMSFEAIAETLGCTRQAAEQCFKRAIRKVRATPGGFEALLLAVQAENRDPLQARSLECRPDAADLMDSRSSRVIFRGDKEI